MVNTALMRVLTMLLLIEAQHTYVWKQLAVLSGDERELTRLVLRSSVSRRLCLYLVFDVIKVCFASLQVENDKWRNQKGDTRDGWERGTSQRHVGAGMNPFKMICIFTRLDFIGYSEISRKMVCRCSKLTESFQGPEFSPIQFLI